MSGTDQYNTHPPTRPNVVVVPMNYAGEVLLVCDAAGLTLPTGMIAAGETAEDAARRILQTATGFKADAWFALEMTTPGDIHLFLARNLEPARSMADAIYQGATERVALDDIDALFESRRLDDPAECEALVVVRRAITGSSRVDQKGADNG